jgi:hypothetical protein
LKLIRVLDARQARVVVLAEDVQSSIILLPINNDHKASLTSLVILHLCIAIDIFLGWTPRTFMIFLIEEVGLALIVAKIITCFEANLALKLAYLISFKDLFIPSTTFCVQWQVL